MIDGPLRRARWLLSGACALAACTPQFDPCFPLPGVVNDLRILGVRVDPPEALADWASGAVQPMSVRLLVSDPIRTTDLPVGADVCAVDSDGACALASVVRETAPLINDDAFQVLSPAEVVQRALALDPLAGFGGVRVRLQVAVTGPLGERLSAQKTLIYAPPSSSDAPNHGLEIVGVRVRRLSHIHHEILYLPMPADDETLLPGELLRLDRLDAVWLRPLLGPGPGGAEAAELYETTDLSGRRVQVRESISYSFFASFGDIAGPHTEVIDPVPYFDPSHEGMEPVAGTDPGLGITSMVGRRASAGVLWIVARDSRGATAWLTVPWQVTDAILPGNYPPNLGPRCDK
jgi:hypothetical protein